MRGPGALGPAVAGFKNFSLGRVIPVASVPLGYILDLNGLV